MEQFKPNNKKDSGYNSQREVFVNKMQPLGYTPQQPIQPMPQMNYQPNIGMPNIPGNVAPANNYLQYTYILNPLEELANSPIAIVKQSPDYTRAIVGCQLPNRYHVFISSGGFFKYLFKAREISGCCERHCCPIYNRSLTMELRHILNSQDFMADFNNQNLYGQILKPSICPCCCCITGLCCICCCRPEFNIQLRNRNQIIGKIRNPYTCCDPVFDIYNEKGKITYVIVANCCQCAYLCSDSCCGKLHECMFSIIRPGGDESHPDGTICKKPANSYSELMTNADTYEIIFPKTAIPYEKLQIISAAIMIDYLIFEGQNESKGSNKGCKALCCCLTCLDCLAG